MKVARGIAGAVVGLLFGLFIGLDLVVFGIVAVDSAAVTVLAGIGLVAGAALAALAAGHTGHSGPGAGTPLPPPA